MPLRSTTLLPALLLAVSTLACAQEKSRGIGTRPPTPAPTAAGSYYALVIGIDTYPASMPQLKTAKSDAATMAQVLEQKYGFHVQRLLDDQATRKGILSAITGYRNVLTSADNLLIYYAGHGALDEGVAYWLPSGSEAGDPSNWVSADDVNHGIRALSAAHVLVVSDSCFSGGLAQPGQRFVAPAKPTVEQAAYLEKMGQRRSRTLMASGGNEPVADAGTAGHSVFAFPLIEGLEHPDQLTFTAQHLFEQSIRIRVGGNARQTPLYTPLANSGHDGGDFIFTRTNLTAAELAAAAPTAASPSAAELKATELYNRGVLLAGASRYSEAIPFLNNSCEAGSGKACAYVGSMYANASGVAKDETRAAKLYKKACDAGEAIGCTRLGGLYAFGKGVVPDSAQAATFYRKACDTGDTRGCVNLGAMYEFGPMDQIKAGDVYPGPCEDERIASCIYVSGDDGPKGKGLPEDIPQALALYRKACDLEDATACAILGRLFKRSSKVDEDIKQAVMYLEKACNGGVSRSCEELGDIFDDGDDVPEDDARAALFYSKACDTGSVDGCYSAGYEYDHDIEDDAKAIVFYRRACDSIRKPDQAARGCSEAGKMYEDGTGTPKDLSVALELYNKGCEGDDASGCEALGIHYEQGTGLPKDKALAIKNYQLACNAKLKTSCDALKRLVP